MPKGLSICQKFEISNVFHSPHKYIPSNTQPIFLKLTCYFLMFIMANFISGKNAKFQNPMLDEFHIWDKDFWASLLFGQRRLGQRNLGRRSLGQRSSGQICYKSDV